MGVPRILLTWSLSSRMLDIERTFLLTSVMAIVVLTAAVVSLEVLTSDVTRDAWLKGIVLGVAVARTSIQYMLAYEAYFPPD